VEWYAFFIKKALLLNYIYFLNPLLDVLTQFLLWRGGGNQREGEGFNDRHICIRFIFMNQCDQRGERAAGELNKLIKTAMDGIL
jgi:hypothetical protein